MLKFKINLKNLIYHDKLNFLNFKSIFFKVIFLKLNFKLTLIKRLFFKKYISMFKYIPKINFFPKKVNIMVYNINIFEKKISNLL